MTKEYKRNILLDTCSDQDGDLLTFTIAKLDGTPLPPWINFDSLNNVIVFSPVSGCQGTLKILLKASDNYGGSASTSFNFQIMNSNPECKSINDQTLNVNQELQIKLQDDFCTDNDGDLLSLMFTQENGAPLPIWIVFDTKTNTLVLNPKSGHQGNYRIKLTSNDGFGGSTFKLFNIAVLNRGITVTSLVSKIQKIGEYFRYEVPANTFIDEDGDQLQLSAALMNGGNIPPWLGFSSGIFSGTPFSGCQGELQIRITANDNFGKSANCIFALSVLNMPPLASPLTDVEFRIGTPFTLQIPISAFSDPDKDPLTFKAQLADGSSLPNWLNFNSQTRILGGTPGSNSHGTHQIKINAEDGFGGSGFSLFKIFIKNADPVCKSLINHVIYMMKEYTVTIPSDLCTDQDGDQLKLELTRTDGSSLPTWINFDSTNKKIVFSPSSGCQGIQNIQLSALDDFGGVSNSVFSFTLLNSAPVCKSLLNQQINIGKEFIFPFPTDFCSDQDDDPLTFLITTGNGQSLPTWINFDLSKLSLSFNPKSGQQGNYLINITIRDSYGALHRSP